MGSFWREYWIWIVAPVVLIVGAVVFLLVLTLLTGGDGEDSAFIYNIF